MELKIVETSLNLRVERRLGKENKDYLLSKDVAEEQLKLEADVYCNVEYMECQDKKYMEAFFITSASTTTFAPALLMPCAVFATVASVSILPATVFTVPVTVTLVPSPLARMPP